MTPETFAKVVMAPAWKILQMPAAIDTLESRVQMIATAGQESGWSDRKQDPSGIARGFWQCEIEAIASVQAGKRTGPFLKTVCDLLDIPADTATIYEAIAWNDALAYAVGRGIYLQDPLPLPGIGSALASWECYLRNWRPGKPRPDAWDRFYATSVSLVKAGDGGLTATSDNGLEPQCFASASSARPAGLWG